VLVCRQEEVLIFRQEEVLPCRQVLLLVLRQILLQEERLVSYGGRQVCQPLMANQSQGCHLDVMDVFLSLFLSEDLVI
jgi:hypothetical protein